MKKLTIITALLAMCSGTAYATLAPDANLSIDVGSSFGMEVSPTIWADISITGFNGINLGTAQAASGSHTGFPDGTENPDIDNPWAFAGNTGMSQSNSPITVLSDDGAGNVTLDLSGWGVTWNGLANINMGTGPSAGVATMTCAVDCGAGDSYTLSYLATVPLDDTSGFGGVNYRLNLVGSIADTTVVAAPLPSGTQLTLDPGVVDVSDCVSGTCFGMEISANIWVWTAVEPGTDGGIVIGKNQVSGDQETGTSETNNTSGELTAAWLFANNFGTLSTSPGGSRNIYSDTPCVGADCIGKTEINALYAAWNGALIPLGGGTVDRWDITLDGNGGGTYGLFYRIIIPEGSFAGVPFQLVARGNVILPPSNTAPVAGNVAITTNTNTTVTWTPIVSDADGDPLTCTVAGNAANGFATIEPDCSSGTYTSTDVSGADSFTYRVTDPQGLFGVGTVSVTVIEPANICAINVPVKMITTSGGGQSTTVNSTVQTTFTGHITTETGLTSGGRNAVKICPGTTVDYETVSSVGTAICSINGVASAASGSMSIGDKLICTNKPDGSDTDRYSVKNGS